MKVWQKVSFNQINKEVEQVTRSFTNYLYYDNIVYQQLGEESKKYLNHEMQQKISGLLMLYYAKNYERMNDIVNKYDTKVSTNIIPVVEGYVEK